MPNKTDDAKLEARIGRRALLQGSAAGGAALAAGLFGPLAAAAAGQGTKSGPAEPVRSGKIRRVLTGQNAAGRSYIAADEVVSAGEGWTTTPDAPLGPAPAGEERADFSRATGDTRFWVLSMAPHDDPKPDLTNRIGFHKTPGVAYIYILSGEVVYLVDEGEVRLQPGDLLVERGTDHSWRNEGPEPVGMLIVLVNAA